MKSLLARSLPSNPVKARRGVKIILSPQKIQNSKPKTGMEGVRRDFNSKCQKYIFTAKICTQFPCPAVCVVDLMIEGLDGGGGGHGERGLQMNETKKIKQDQS